MVSADRRLSVRAALDSYGLFEPTDAIISDHMKTLIDNRISSVGSLFSARTMDDL
jgi:hypothetical protein